MDLRDLLQQLVTSDSDSDYSISPSSFPPSSARRTVPKPPESPPNPPSQAARDASTQAFLSLLHSILSHLSALSPPLRTVSSALTAHPSWPSAAAREMLEAWTLPERMGTAEMAMKECVGELEEDGKPWIEVAKLAVIAWREDMDDLEKGISVPLQLVNLLPAPEREHCLRARDQVAFEHAAEDLLDTLKHAQAEVADLVASDANASRRHDRMGALRSSQPVFDDGDSSDDAEVLPGGVELPYKAVYAPQIRLAAPEVPERGQYPRGR